jgi:hypothetical protein
MFADQLVLALDDNSDTLIAASLEAAQEAIE